jgi:hypothetical protein
LVIPKRRYEIFSICNIPDGNIEFIAVEFLLQNNFRMQAPYEDGVHYLSRDEERIAMAKTVERNQAVARSYINIAESDHESLKFLADIRQIIDAWLARGKVGNIPFATSQRLSTAHWDS